MQDIAQLLYELYAGYDGFWTAWTGDEIGNAIEHLKQVRDEIQEAGYGIYYYTPFHGSHHTVLTD